MDFAKYQGAGNDFVMIADPQDSLKLTSEMVRRLCDRRFGIGGDGVIRIAPGRGNADFFMDYVNSDGSIGEMCGNGIRCLAIYAREVGLTDQSEITVDTRAGLKTVSVLDDGQVRVDMGPPIFDPPSIPVDWEGPDALHARISPDGNELEVAALSIGNSHAVLFVDDPDEAPVTTLGPRIETNESFAKGTNVEFVRVLSPDHIKMRVWERGSGETLACGTGACAAAVASRLLAGANERVIVEMPGGEVEVEWAGTMDEPGTIFMTGAAVKSFEGVVEV